MEGLGICAAKHKREWKDGRVGSVLQGAFDARSEEFSAALNSKSTGLRGFPGRPGFPLPW
jgi:hypothetical protein